MKKNLFLTIALLCAFAQGLVLTSCSKDDNPAVEPAPSKFFTLRSVQDRLHV